MFLLSSEENIDKQDLLEGIAYNKADLILYTEGLTAYKKEGGLCSELKSGRFIIKYRDNNNIIIRTDEIGNELLFYYTNENFWCVSTSFLGLAWYLKDKGYKLTASKVELAKFFVKTSLFEQPYNNNLAIKEINILNAKSEIHVNAEEGFRVFNREDNIQNINDSFFESLNNFIDSSRSIIESFVVDFEVNLELSGGLDSRIVMGLALPYKEKILISSDKNRTNDYIIAKSLSSLFDMKFREKPYRNNGDKRIQDKWLLYKLANIGISRTVPVPNGASGTEFSKIVRLNGGGGGTTRVFYNTNCEAYYNLIKNSGFTIEMEIKLINDLKSTLDFFNYHEDPQHAMVNIYSEYRHRYFAGRAWYYSLFGIIFAPMSSKAFKSILDSPDIEEVFNCSKEEIKNRNLVILFILYILNKDLAIIRFDEESKDFSFEDMKKIEGVVGLYKNSIFSSKKSHRYGDISNGSVLPPWSKKYSINYNENDKSYENFIYKDILGIVDKLEEINILNKEYLNKLMNQIDTKTLSKNDKLACLHIKTIIEATDSIEN